MTIKQFILIRIRTSGERKKKRNMREIMIFFRDSFGSSSELPEHPPIIPIVFIKGARVRSDTRCGSDIKNWIDSTRRLSVYHGRPASKVHGFDQIGC